VKVRERSLVLQVTYFFFSFFALPLFFLWPLAVMDLQFISSPLIGSKVQRYRTPLSTFFLLAQPRSPFFACDRESIGSGTLVIGAVLLLRPSPIPPSWSRYLFFPRGNRYRFWRLETSKASVLLLRPFFLVLLTSSLLTRHVGYALSALLIFGVAALQEDICVCAFLVLYSACSAYPYE